MAAHGAAFFAHNQLAGKGQRGKGWNSEPSANIILSVVINPSPLLITQQFVISVMASLAVHDFFADFAGDETKIKWPNDLYWRDRKAGGILMNSHILGKNWQYSVLGIGININQTNFVNFPNQPVSLKQITGKTYQPLELAKQLCSLLEKRFAEMRNGGIEDQLNKYNQYLYKKGEEVNFKKENIVFRATVQSVNDYGELILKNGLEDRFGFGEISWLI